MGPLALVGALAAAGVAWGAGRALHRFNRAAVRDAERRYPPAGAFLEVDGTRLHYMQQGSGPDVVFLHGAAGTIHDFDRVVGPLARDFRLTLLDRPGHGYSATLPRGADDAAAQSRLLRRALDRLDVETPIVLGYSWGAALALRYALDHPDATGALVLVGGTTHIGTAPRNPLYWILRTPVASEALIALGLVPIGRPYMGVPLGKVFAPDSTPRDYLQRARAMWVRPEPVRSMTRDFHGLAAALREMRPRYGSLELPVVVVTGDRDRLVDYERNSMAFAREARRVEVLLVPGAGHALPQARPDAVVQGIRRAASMTSKREG